MDRLRGTDARLAAALRGRLDEQHGAQSHVRIQRLRPRGRRDGRAGPGDLPTWGAGARIAPRTRPPQPGGGEGGGGREGGRPLDLPAGRPFSRPHPVREQPEPGAALRQGSGRPGRMDASIRLLRADRGGAAARARAPTAERTDARGRPPRGRAPRAGGQPSRDVAAAAERARPGWRERQRRERCGARAGACERGRGGAGRTVEARPPRRGTDRPGRLVHRGGSRPRHVKGDRAPLLRLGSGTGDGRDGRRGPRGAGGVRGRAAGPRGRSCSRASGPSPRSGSR